MALQDTLDAFIEYVQQELFKRPFSAVDPKQETVMVRRGGGPRQLVGLELNNLELVGRRNGVITGIPISDLGTPGVTERKMVFTQADEELEWTITHEFSSQAVEVYIVDLDNQRIHPDEIQATDLDTVVIKFTQAQAGKAFLRWF